jgi:EAL domain-containing protein (putative c-di-GMP-specific phosphodiesterase class I)
MDAENYAIVKTIVGLAHNLDLKVVAEGVETTNQREKSRRTVEVRFQ